MKAEWKNARLGDIADVQSGGTPAISNKQLWDGGIPWYSSGELNNTFTTDPERTVSAAGLEKSNAKLFPAGSLLIGMYDTAAMKMSILDRDGAFNQAIAGVKPNDQIDIRFIFYALNSIKEELLGQRRGVRQKNLSLGKVRDFLFPFPSLKDQQRIVTLLDEAFDDIATAKSNADKNLKNARELFGVLLNRVLSTAEQTCGVVAFGDVVTRSRGGVNIKSTDYCAEGIPVLTKGDVKPFGIVEYGGKCVSEFDEQTQSWPRSSPGDFIVTTRDLKPSAPFLGLVGRIPNDRAYVVNQGATLFAINDDRVDPNYFLHWCSADRYRDFVRSKRVGSTQVHIRQGDLFSAPLCLPPAAEQKAIVEKLDAAASVIDQLAATYQQKLTALDDLKKSLLHRAFNGDL